MDLEQIEKEIDELSSFLHGNDITYQEHRARNEKISYYLFSIAAFSGLGFIGWLLDWNEKMASVGRISFAVALIFAGLWYLLVRYEESVKKERNEKWGRLRELILKRDEIKQKQA